MKKAEMGIGTLIIFIAMILVAAIAAGVLLQTAGSLQNKALETGQKSKGQISTTMTAILLFGENGTTGVLNDFFIKAKLAPGAESLKVSEMLLSVDLVNSSADLIYGGTGCTKPARNSTGHLTTYSGDYFTYRTQDEAKGTGTTGKGNFTVKYLLQSANYKAGYMQRGDIVQFCFESSRIVNEDEKFSIKIIPKVGTPMYIETSTPDIITQQRVMIYP